MTRRRQPGPDPDDIHREMLDHLADHPPPRPKRPAPEAKTKPATEAPKTTAIVPRLMLRKMRLEPALASLDAFVRQQVHRRTPKVIVVVGRGLRSGAEGPVIGPAVRRWCDDHPELVRGVRVGLPSEGGEGVLVLDLAGD